MKMLLSLQGITHQVHTGVGVIFPAATGQGERLVKSFSETTKVTFASLDEAEMSAYIKTGEPFDKAGGYGGCTSRFICFLWYYRGPEDSSFYPIIQHFVFSPKTRALSQIHSQQQVVKFLSAPQKNKNRRRYPRSSGCFREFAHRMLL